jgi:cysteine synthase
MEIQPSVLATVGNTPLVRLQRIPHKNGIDLLAKVEGFNPMGSVKERIALAMVEGAEREGRLHPGLTLVESSSGNTGIGLAMVAAVKGYRVLITMSRKASVERRKILRSLGAELILVDGGSDDAWDRADQIAASDPKKYFRIHQYQSEWNVRCHYETTGPEIWRQTGGRIDAFVATLGTTGTVVGAGRFLKERNPKCRIIAAQPDTKDHRQQGIRTLRYNRTPPIYDASIPDEVIEVRDEEAFHWAQELARREGIFAGISSGTALWAALQVAQKLERGVMVVLFPDRGEKYLSTDLFACRGDPAVEPP